MREGGGAVIRLLSKERIFVPRVHCGRRGIENAEHPVNRAIQPGGQPALPNSHQYSCGESVGELALVVGCWQQFTDKTRTTLVSAGIRRRRCVTMLPHALKKRFPMLSSLESTVPNNDKSRTKPQLNCTREILDTS
jgi:hypothetical protein